MSTPRTAATAALLSVAALASCGDSPSAGMPPPAVCGDATVELAVGQAAVLAASGTGARCDLRGPAGAEYVLAYADTRAIEAARTGPEGGGAPYTLAILPGAPALDASAAARVAGDPPASPPDHVDTSMAAAAFAEASPYARSAPWRTGDAFQVDEGDGPRPARVMRVYDGYLVVAWLEGHLPEQRDAYLQTMDAAYPILRDESLPLLEDMFGVPRPVTSTDNGQYLVLLRADRNAEASGWASSNASGDTVRAYINLSLLPFTSHVAMASLWTHETAHSFQRVYMHASRPAGAQPAGYGTATWNIEGGANLASWEVTRRLAGYGLTENAEPAAGGAGAVEAWYFNRIHPGNGNFRGGYDNSATFLRDLVVRRVREGESADDALAHVSRGAVEGWHGVDALRNQRRGLTDRMRERLGAGWTPADALLTWALSYVADDRTASPVFQERAYREAWRAREGAAGWAADAEIDGLRSVTVQRPFGNLGYVRIRPAAADLPLVTEASVPGVRQMVMRVR